MEPRVKKVNIGFSNLLLCYLPNATMKSTIYLLLKLYAYLFTRLVLFIEFKIRRVLQKKFHEKDSVRQGTAALIGRLLYCTLCETPEEDVDFEKFYASYLPENTFIELYEVLWQLSGDPSEHVRAEVLNAVYKLQKYPGLMEVIPTHKYQTVKECRI